jgi:mRNA interferase MazF
MKQSEVWLINLDPTIGAEIKKTRPSIIVSDDSLGKLPLRVIVPITDWKERYQIAPWMIKLAPNLKNGLTKDSSADCFQVRSVSQERFIKRMGYVSEIVMEEIKIGLSKVLSIENE